MRTACELSDEATRARSVGSRCVGSSSSSAACEAAVERAGCLPRSFVERLGSGVDAVGARALTPLTRNLQRSGARGPSSSTATVEACGGVAEGESSEEMAP